eukprot:PITA_08724
MLMQLDLSKAYDKVSWKYLEAVLKAFGFCSTWIKWIMALIKSPRYSILVNGAPSAPFAPSRGIRKGDPLSPFLFIVLMEGLSRTIAKKKTEGKIRGLQPIRSLPTTTHQQFVDDTMLHGTPTVKEAVSYKETLDLFSQASGRLVLTKSILQAIPHYLLSFLPAPKGILQQIRNIQRSFLWSGNGEKKKWALVAWNKLCMSKSRGGLNLVDPEVVNQTCGAKLWWRWIENPTLPWAKHWKEKYVPDCDIQELIRLQETPEGSPIWNHAKRNKNLVQEKSFWEIRNGRLALFWEDAWQQLPKLDSP